MKYKIYSSLKLVLLLLVCIASSEKTYAQNTLYPLSFKANQTEQADYNAKYYYSLQKEGNNYVLTDAKQRNVLQNSFDTIVYNDFFIKAIKKDLIFIYRIPTLEEIETPNAKQIYLVRDGLEVLTPLGPQYYDNAILKIIDFSEIELFGCGAIYDEQYTLIHSKETKSYSIRLSVGNFGSLDETIINLENVPDNSTKISFLNGENYVSNNINNTYDPIPNLIKIEKDGKTGIYFYNYFYNNEAMYPEKVMEKPEYFIEESSGDTIYKPIPIEPISFIKNRSVKIEEIVPISYSQIQLNPKDGLVYLYKDGLIGIYPQHKATDFEVFEQKTASFYKIVKNGKQGWLDRNTFEEYYFE